MNIMHTIASDACTTQAPKRRFVQILSVSVFEKTEISCAVQGVDPAIDLHTSANHLNLFNIQPDGSSWIGWLKSSAAGSTLANLLVLISKADLHCTGVFVFA